MPELTISDEARKRFATLSALQDRHAALVKEIGKDLLAPENLARIEEFVRNAVKAGAVLDAKEDRTAAQGLVNFWTARLSSAERTAGDGASAAVKVPRFEDTLLDEFDPATIRAASLSTDHWLKSLPAPDQALVRRIMLRLLRLLPDTPAFEPVPAVRGALYELATPAQVDALLDGLATTGVVRVTKADSAEMDRVALRSRDLISQWPTLKTWMDARLAFRALVGRWEQNGRPNAELMEGDPLEESRSYHDRNDPERQFIKRSRYRELRRNVRNRYLKWVLGALLAVSILFVFTISNRNEALSRVNRELAISEQRAREAEKIAKEAEKIAKKESLGLARRGRLTTLRLLVRGLAEIAAAPTDSDRDLALARWDALKGQLEGAKAPELTLGMDLAELRREAAEPDNINKLSAATIGEIREQRVSNATGPETEELIKSMREVSFKMVRLSAERAVDVLRVGPYSEARPFIREFWTQYWGEMLLVEGETVEGAMVAYGTVLGEIEKTKGSHEEALVEAAKEVVGARWPSIEVKFEEAVDQAYRMSVNELKQSMRKRTGLSDAEADQIVTKAWERQVPKERFERLEQALQLLNEALEHELKQEALPAYYGAKAL
ncbi:MAG: hypothetical protein ACM3U2_03100 [Deltaproteobacteria bacterium]